MSVYGSMPSCCLCTWCPRRSKEGIRSPESAVADTCELPYEYRGPKLCPLQTQQVILPVSCLSGPSYFFILSSYVAINKHHYQKQFIKGRVYFGLRFQRDTAHKGWEVGLGSRAGTWGNTPLSTHGKPRKQEAEVRPYNHQSPPPQSTSFN